jgi:sensor histidine kinase YesM
MFQHAFDLYPADIHGSSTYQTLLYKITRNDVPFVSLRFHLLALPPYDHPLFQFMAHPRYRWLRHSSFILIGIVLGFKGDIGGVASQRSPEMYRAFILADIWTFIFIMGIMYLLILYLVPKLLFRSKLVMFSASFLVCISAIYFFVWYADYVFLWPVDDMRRPRLQHVELSVLAYIQYCAIGAVLLGSIVGACIFKKWILDMKRFNELQQLNFRTELAQLKSQVNPHFLFNTLNNLFVLTKTDPERAGKVLIKLSELLRYQLYDTTRDRIALSKDIAFIDNFLSLEKVRHENFECSIRKSGDVDTTTLPPFMFIPFVENAVKHGTSGVAKPFIHLEFAVSANRIEFNCINSRSFTPQKLPGGIGLANVRRRLELLYPGRYELNTNDSAETFAVKLTLHS